MHRVNAAAKALIQQNGKYLFLRETFLHGDEWDLPGGKIEYGESPEVALHREIKEEVDLEVTIDGYAGVWWFISHKTENEAVCSTFFCSIKGSDRIDMTKNPADEHFEEYKWMTIDEAIKNTDAKLVDSLRDLLQKLM